VAETTVCAAGLDALVKRWDKYPIRLKMFFQIRISHVLRFISICDLFTDSPSYVRFEDFTVVVTQISIV
jgi:hypothetical protein